MTCLQLQQKKPLQSKLAKQLRFFYLVAKQLLLLLLPQLQFQGCAVLQRVSGGGQRRRGWIDRRRCYLLWGSLRVDRGYVLMVEEQKNEERNSDRLKLLKVE